MIRGLTCKCNVQKKNNYQPTSVICWSISASGGQTNQKRESSGFLSGLFGESAVGNLARGRVNCKVGPEPIVIN